MVLTENLVYRCFDKILVFVDLTLEESMIDDYLHLTNHHIKFLQHVYGSHIAENTGIFVTVDDDEQDVDHILKLFKKIKVSKAHTWTPHI